MGDAARIHLGPHTLRRGLTIATVGVILLGLLAEAARPWLGLVARKRLVPYFSLSYEQNIPTFYAAVLLLGCCVLLGTIAAAKAIDADRFYKHWWGLAAGFAYISLDEVVQIHEFAGVWLDLDGVLYFSWVLPAGVLLLLLGVAYFRFVLSLPQVTRGRFVIAGGIYVGGAVLMELPLGMWTEQHGQQNFGYAAIDAIEESLELIGIRFFLLALLDYLGSLRCQLWFTSEKFPVSELK